METYNIKGKKYTEKDMRRICNNAVSLWGGELDDYRVEDNEIIIFGTEHGEDFATKLSFDEIEEYNY